MRRKLKIKTGDIVKVIAGNQKGTQGKVMRVYANTNRAIVEGVNVVKKHNKPNANNPKGGITEKELSIDISNPSSPVYPDLVIYKLTPSNIKLFPVINFRFVTPLIRLFKISTDLGPCRAIRE